MQVDRRGALVQLRVLGGHHSEEDAGATPLQGRGSEARVLQGMPADLQQETLLGIHVDRFAPGDLEEGGVKSVDSVEMIWTIGTREME